MERGTKIPAIYQTVMPYLILKDAAKFIAFTQKVFDAIVTQNIMRDENKVMHAEIMIGESTLMIANASAAFGTQTAGLFVYVNDAVIALKKRLMKEPASSMNYPISLMEELEVLWILAGIPGGSLP